MADPSKSLSVMILGIDSFSKSLSQISNNINTALQASRDLAIEEEESKRGLKRKIQKEQIDDSQQKFPKEEGRLKKAKKLAISMATKAASLATELKSIKLDMFYMQERCNLLEEENRRLRDGFSPKIIPDEDDLVTLQLEALLAEKSRLANENANLTRESQCLNQLMEYHWITSQDLSVFYEEPIQRLEGTRTFI